MVGLLVALVLVVRSHVGVPAQDMNLNNKIIMIKKVLKLPDAKFSSQYHVNKMFD